MGRGRYDTAWRRRWERSLDRFYGGGWAARCAYALGLQGGLRVREHRLVIPTDGPATSLRLAFASDFHAGPLTDQRLLVRAFAAIAAFRPDVLLLGGDYISFDARHLPRLVAALGPLRPPLGTYAVLGNHDLWADDQAIVAGLEAVGVQVLVNRSCRLAGAHADLSICGLDDPGIGAPDAAATFAAAAPWRILLMHAPGGAPLVAGQRFHAAFCGHTHGGQIALPGGIPIVLPHGSGPRQHAHGIVPLPPHGAPLLVSRGIGMSEVPVRLFAPSEVHLCTVERPQGAVENT